MGDQEWVIGWHHPEHLPLSSSLCTTQLNWSSFDLASLLPQPLSSGPVLKTIISASLSLNAHVSQLSLCSLTPFPVQSVLQKFFKLLFL